MTARLRAILEENAALQEILRLTPELGLSRWYLGAGCIAQTVWNVQHGFEPGAHIKDYDLVYFDASDLSFEAEDRVIQAARILLAHIPVAVEVRNQARVHLWYERRFGYPIPPYRSVHDAIDSWPTTATAIGVRQTPIEFAIYAPFGLEDLFAMIARPNKRQVTEEVYVRKVERWRTHWPRLRILSWDQA